MKRGLFRRLVSKIILGAVAVFTVCAVCPAAAAAKDGVVTVGFDVQPGAFSYDDEGQLEGYCYEFSQRVAQIAGFDIEYEHDSWSSTLKKLATGETQLVFYANYTNVRDEKYLYSKLPVSVTYGELFARNDDDRFSYSEYEAFNGKTIGVLWEAYEETSLKEYAAKNGFSFHTRYYNTNGEAINGLKSGEVDLVALEHQVSDSDMKTVGEFDAQELYAITSVENAALMAKIDAAMEYIAIYYPKYGAELYEKYYGADETEAALTREEKEYVEHAGAVRIGLPSARVPVSAYNAKTGEFDGIMESLLDIVSEKTGLEFDYEPISVYSSTYRLLSKNNFTLVAPVVSEGFYDYGDAFISDALCQSGITFIARKGLAYSNSIDYTVALPRDMEGLEGVIAAAHSGWEIKFYDTGADCLEALKDGEVKLAANDTYAYSYLLQKPEYAELQTVTDAAIPYSNCIGAGSEVDPLLASVINKGINAVSDEEISNIIIEHVGKTVYKYTLTDYLYANRSFIVPVCIVLVFVVLLIIVQNSYKKRKKYLEHKADIDKMCQVYNRGALEERAEALMRQEQKCAFLIYDLDNFKNINDTLGHAEGDKLLYLTADIMKQTFRINDIVGRIGGDEFVAFLCGVKSKEAIVKKAEESLKRIKALSERFSGANVSASIGIAFFPDDGKSFRDLYTAADAAMYAVKKAKKGGVAVCGENAADCE